MHGFGGMGAMRCRLGLVAGSAVSAALVIAACGSTVPIPTQPSAVAPSPVVPSTVLPVPPSFASLVGQWGGSVGISFMYRDPDVPGSSHCDASASVSRHTADSLSASVGFNGSSMDSDKQCGRGFSFVAEMEPDGTFISARLDYAALGSHECYPASQPVFRSGSASSTGFRVVVLDSTVCRWPPLLDSRYPPVRDTDRTFTIVIDRRRSTVLPQ